MRRGGKAGELVMRFAPSQPVPLCCGACAWSPAVSGIGRWTGSVTFAWAGMVKHASDAFRCPFCALIAGTPCAGLQSVPQDIVYRDDLAVAFVASHWWERNPGHVLVVPVCHYENIYDLPDEVGARIFSVSRRVAIAVKRSYGCDGISTRQHNEPAGCQDVWHYHLHVFPRYENDRLYAAGGDKRLTSPEQRQPFAARLSR